MVGWRPEWNELKPVLGRGLALATIALIINAVLVALVLRMLFPVSWPEGLLFGSIIGCTDAAAVFSVLRSKTMRLRSGLGTLAELESAANDPMAVFLSLALIQIIKTPDASMWSMVPMFFIQMGLGAAIGWVIGLDRSNNDRLVESGTGRIYPALTISIALLTYAITASLGGSGFLAAYVCGILINTKRFRHKESLIRFHTGFSWLLQIVMFVTLGLLLRLPELWQLAPEGLLISIFIVIVARPVSVFATLTAWRMTWREMLMSSWLGLRGAVPIILATLTLYSGVRSASLIFNLVFFVVLLSVMAQGMTLAPMARWLRVSDSRAQ